ncbi:MAG: DUF2190 family protein [bacterium]|nr:DUF2190 family protein [bacterium]
MSDLYNAQSTCGVKATVNIDEHKFVDFDGDYPAPGFYAKGIAHFEAIAGEMVTLINGGTALLELGSDGINIGDEIAVGVDGVGVTTAAGNYIMAIAEEAGNTEDIIEARLVRYQKNA